MTYFCVDWVLKTLIIDWDLKTITQLNVSLLPARILNIITTVCEQDWL